MRSIFSLLLVLLVADGSQAGLFKVHSKGCSDGCPRFACEPVIARPSRTTIFNHQRRISGTKSCGEDACGPASCCTPVACLGADCSAPELFCTPEAAGCGTENHCSPKSGCLAPVACCDADIGCCSDGCCGEGCGTGAACYSNEDCKVIAQLIYESMTGCYASIRRKAIHRLGDHFDCVCHPDIMTAFVHALNDSDESVRAKAADEIGDQIRRNRVCVGPPVIRGLQAALGDCDRAVRRQAEQALRLAGYRIVDGACCTACVAPQVTSQKEFSLSQVEPSSETEAGRHVVLPLEAELSAHTPEDGSLRVRPVSSSIVAKLKPITDKLRRKSRFESDAAAIPPPAPAEEPDDYVPSIPAASQFENPQPKRGLMNRWFGRSEE